MASGLCSPRTQQALQGNSGSALPAMSCPPLGHHLITLSLLGILPTFEHQSVFCVSKCPSPGTIAVMKHHVRIGVGRVYLAYTSTSVFITGESWDRNSRQAGTLKAGADAEAVEAAAHWLASHSTCFLVEARTTSPGDGSTHSGLGLSPSPINH